MLARILGVLLLIGGVALGDRADLALVRRPLWFARCSCGRPLGCRGALYRSALAARREHRGSGRRGLSPTRWNLAGILGRVELGIRHLWGMRILLLQVALVLAMLYVGWRWVDNGEFSLRRWRV